MIAMMIIIIPIKRPATRPGFEKNPPLPEFASDVTIEGAVDVGEEEEVGVVPSEGETGGLDAGGVVVDDEVELSVELADVLDGGAVCTKHEYTANYGEPQNRATQSHPPPKQ